MIGSLPQVLSVKAHSYVLQVALIVAWSNSRAKQLARFLWRGVTYRKSSIRPCMKLWKLLCLVIEVSASSAMLPNTWDPQKEEGRSQKAQAALQICVTKYAFFLIIMKYRTKIIGMSSAFLLAGWPLFSIVVSLRSRFCVCVYNEYHRIQF